MISCNEDGSLCRGLFGPLAAIQELQTVPRSEVFALLRGLQVIDRSIPTLFYSDCALVVETFALGEAALCRDSLESAELWKQIFSLSRGGGHKVVKVKAHVPQKVAQLLDAEGFAIWKGNQLADDFAKKGAAAHAVPDDLRDTLTEYDANYVGFLKFACSVKLICMGKNERWENEGEAGGAAAAPHAATPKLSLAARVANHMQASGDSDGCQQDLVEVRGYVACLACGKRRKGVVGLRSLIATRCPGSVKCRLTVSLCGRVRASSSGEERTRLLTSRNHTMCITGPYQWCTKCGRHTSGRTVRGLAGACTGIPRMGEYGYYQRKRLSEGCHSATGRPLR